MAEDTFQTRYRSLISELAKINQKFGELGGKLQEIEDEISQLRQYREQQLKGEGEV